MANESNLKLIQTSDEARELGRNGGIKSGEARRKKKKLQEAALMFLEMKPTDINFQKNLSMLGVPQENMTYYIAVFAKMMQEAMSGNVRAAEFLRDAAGLNTRDLLQEEALAQMGISRDEGNDNGNVIIYVPDNGRETPDIIGEDEIEGDEEKEG